MKCFFLVDCKIGVKDIEILYVGVVFVDLVIVGVENWRNKFGVWDFLYFFLVYIFDFGLSINFIMCIVCLVN